MDTLCFLNNERELLLVVSLVGLLVVMVVPLLISIYRAKGRSLELAERERQMATLMSNFPGMAYRAFNDRDRTLVYVSEGCVGLTGYYPCDFLGTCRVTFGGVIHPEDRERVWESIQRNVAQREPFEMIYRVVTLGEEERWVWERGCGVYGGNGVLEALEGFVSDITDWKNKSDALRTSEARYRDLVQNANSIIMRRDLLGRVTFFNEYAQEYFGYREEEILGRNVVGTILPKCARPACKEVEKAYGGVVADSIGLSDLPCGDPVDTDSQTAIEMVNLRRSGEPVWVSWTQKAIRDETGAVVEILCIGQDITERKQAERALRDSEKRYRELADLLPQPVFELNEEAVITFVNRAAFEMFGYCAEDFEQGFHASSLLVPEDRERAMQSMRERMAGRKTGYTEYTALKKDGGRFPILIYSSPFEMENRVVGLRGLIIDITKRKRLEEERETIIELLRLLNSAANFREMLHSVSLFLWIWSGCDTFGVRMRMREGFPYFEAKGFSEDISPEENRFWSSDCVAGETRESVLFEEPDGMEQLCPPCPSDQTFVTEYGSLWSNAVLEHLAEAHDRCARDSCCMSLMNDGFESVAIIPLRSSRRIIGLLQFNDRRKGRFSAETIDFMERLAEHVAIALAQRRAEEERMLLSSAVEQTGEMIVITDTEGVIQFVNPAFERITGYSRQEAVGQTPRILKSDKHEVLFYENMWDVLNGGNVWRGRLFNRKKDGTLLEEEATISPVRDVSNRIVNYVAVKRDMTQEVTLERQLRQSQKMEALGTLAGGIAHDFNNILGAILGYAELSRLRVEADAKLRFNLEQIIKAGKRARDLVQQILAFSRKGEQGRKPVQVQLIMKEVMTLLRASLPSTLEIRMLIEVDAATVMADPTQIHQVIMNLCSNAAHAMRRGGGVLTVRLGRVEVGERELRACQDLQSGRYVRLTVQDKGQGIPRELFERIFDPYFTTKEKGVGTGLGLAVVHGIVKNHGGGIIVESAVGEGSAFHVYLPEVEQQSAGEEQGGEEIPTGTERLLLVDDERVLVEMSCQMLEKLGYRVTACVSSMDARKLFEADPRGVDLVITDMTMPNLTGVELAEGMLSLRPDLPIILWTGFDELITRDKARSLGIRELIFKPVLYGELAKTIRRVLVEGTKGQTDA